MSKKKHYDIVILGVGPAGLQAAIHATRKKTSVLLLGRLNKSSLYKAHIENYCCIEGVKTGKELLEAGLKQATSFGAKHIEEDVIRTEKHNKKFLVETESHIEIECYSIIMATGISRKGLGLDREKEFVGRGVSYCVDCDANFYKDKVVAVVGDGSAAASGALTLSKLAKHVTLISKELDISAGLKEDLAAAQVEVLEGRKVKELIGDNELKAIKLDNDQKIDLDGLFIEKGAKGTMELAAFLGVTLDPEHFTYIITNKNQETNVEGIYACGDVCGPPFQMAKAVGEGCIAGMNAASYVNHLKRKSKEG